MSLVQAREILWNGIINTVKSVWQFLSNKRNLQNKAQFAKKLIDLLNSKFAKEMKEFGIEDKTLSM